MSLRGLGLGLGLLLGDPYCMMIIIRNIARKKYIAVVLQLLSIKYLVS
jgi:hypothetical protein